MQQLFELFPAVWSDARAILARRWWLGLLCAIALGSATAWALSVPSGAGPRLVTTAVLLLTTLVVWFVVYAETRRREDPAYAVTGEARADLFWLVLLFALAETVIAVPVFWILSNAHQPLLGLIWFFVVDAYLRGRFGYVFFLPALDDRIGYSSKLSSGPALVPSLALGAIFALSMQIPNYVLARVVPGAIAQGALPLVDFVALAFVFPWTFRWMRVAEAMQPGAEEATPA